MVEFQALGMATVCERRLREGRQLTVLCGGGRFAKAALCHRTPHVYYHMPMCLPHKYDTHKTLRMKSKHV